MRSQLVKSFMKVGGFILPSTFQHSRPGTDIHYGGTIRMSTLPNEFGTDFYGRLHKFKNVYCVDASILNKIPAAPHTFGMMANAHRIASTF